MSPFLIALAAVGQTAAAAPSPVPPDIMFLFFKVRALHDRAHAFSCRTGSQDERYEAVRKRLIDHYGPSIFAPKEPAEQPPGDCGVAMVYDVNLGDLERAAAVAMAPKSGN